MWVWSCFIVQPPGHSLRWDIGPSSFPRNLSYLGGLAPHFKIGLSG